CSAGTCPRLKNYSRRSKLSQVRQGPESCDSTRLIPFGDNWLTTLHARQWGDRHKPFQLQIYFPACGFAVRPYRLSGSCRFSRLCNEPLAGRLPNIPQAGPRPMTFGALLTGWRSGELASEVANWPVKC